MKSPMPAENQAELARFCLSFILHGVLKNVTWLVKSDQLSCLGDVHVVCYSLLWLVDLLIFFIIFFKPLMDFSFKKHDSRV